MKLFVKSLKVQDKKLRVSVVDWHRFDADPEPTFHFDADIDPEPVPFQSLRMLKNLNFS
jgi:hypothetical protein